MERSKMEYIYDKYKNTVYRAAFAMCRNISDAEDITQETFLVRFGREEPFSDESHEKAWLLRIAVNKCKDMFRSFRYKKSVPLEEAALVYETPQESNVYHAVMELPPKYRIVIHLYYYEGYSVKEICRINGGSETAVQTQLYRARKLLEKKLGEEMSI